MAWIRKRTGVDGRPQYQACYRDGRDQIATAGTFTSKKDAAKAGHEAEVLLRQGRMGAAQLGRRTFTFYVNEIWFPNHVLEPSTREGYRYTIDKHLMPQLGPLTMSNIFPPHTRYRVTARVPPGVSPRGSRHTTPASHPNHNPPTTAAAPELRGHLTGPDSRRGAAPAGA